jgi:hypothetical protein
MGTLSKKKLRLMGVDEFGICPKCKCTFHRHDLTVHHVIPMKYVRLSSHSLNTGFNGNQTYILLCRKCHTDIHRVYHNFNPVIIAEKIVNERKESSQKHQIDYENLFGVEVKHSDFDSIYERVCLNFRKLCSAFLENKITPIVPLSKRIERGLI